MSERWQLADRCKRHWANKVIDGVVNKPCPYLYYASLSCDRKPDQAKIALKATESIVSSATNRSAIVTSLSR